MPNANVFVAFSWMKDGDGRSDKDRIEKKKVSCSFSPHEDSIN